MATKTLNIKVTYLDGLDTIEDPEERAELQQECPDFQALKVVSVEVDGQAIEVEVAVMGDLRRWPVLEQHDCALVLELGYY